MLDTIVIGVDGRSGGRDALLAAARLVRPGGTLIAAGAFSAGQAGAHAPRLGAEALGREAADAMLRDELAGAGVAAEPVSIAAHTPARAIAELADQVGADLIVLGRAHRGAVGRTVGGDVTRGVIRRARRPVAIAAGSGEPAADARVVVGYDGSTAARGALDWAVAAAAELGHALHVVSAMRPVPDLAPSPLYGAAWIEPAASVAEHARRTLDEALERCGHGATGEVADAAAPEALASASASAALLVVGSRGEGAVSRVLLGSTSDALTHRAACPIVVVPAGAAPPGREARSEQEASA